MRWRYLVILGWFVVAFLAITLRLFYWQVVQASTLSAMAQAQYGNLVDILPSRGEIYTSDDFPVVTNRLSYLVFANPKEVKNVGDTSLSLSSFLKIDFASTSALLSKNSDKYWVALKGDVDAKEKKSLEQMNIPGIGFEESYSRYYPEASMAAHLLGFVGKDELGNPKGYSGVEGFYDRQLSGRIGKATEIHDALGRPVLSKIDGVSGAQDGRSLKLTIDRSLQFLAEDRLKKGIERYEADSGMVAIMDPHTGNMLAMASLPTFDPRSYGDFDDSLYKNPFITDTYEPGSTLKPLIMSAAFDNGLLKPNSICPICDKPVQVADYSIETWDKKHFAQESMMDVIRHSDNVGMVYVSKVLGKDKMLTALDKFGMGKSTGIDLQGETTPYFPDSSYWKTIDLATASFGQGIVVTPIELLDAFSSIANDGVRMQPHVVSKIITPEGEGISIQPKILDRTMSAKTAKTMTEVLVYTVNKGEAQFARLHGYRIAGKTGTASVAVAGHYDPTQTIASFIGFAPADNPKFVMLVILNHPKAAIYGAETAAPIFFDIAKNMLEYYGVTPTEKD